MIERAAQSISKTQILTIETTVNYRNNPCLKKYRYKEGDKIKRKEYQIRPPPIAGRLRINQKK